MWNVDGSIFIWIMFKKSHIINIWLQEQEELNACMQMKDFILLSTEESSLYWYTVYSRYSLWVKFEAFYFKLQ